MVDGGKARALGLLAAVLGAALMTLALMDGAEAAPFALRSEGPATGDPRQAEGTPASSDVAAQRSSLPKPEQLHPMAPIPQAVDPADPSQIRQWIRDLRNDDISGNAATAFHALSRHMADAESMLLPVVFRGDEQQRVLATGLVQRYRLSLPGDSPPKGFLYASWKLVGYRGEPIQLHESHDIAVRYLARHAKAAAPLVYRTGGLADQDPSRRLIAAWLMARSGGKHPMDVLSGILIHHLQDNDVWGDAVMACNGLHALGTKVIPYLRMARSTADEQATELINLVETDLINPPRTAEDFRQRSRQQSVTRIYADPAIEYDPQRSGIPHPW